jgi:hypothetical protein
MKLTNQQSQQIFNLLYEKLAKENSLLVQQASDAYNQARKAHHDHLMEMLPSEAKLLIKKIKAVRKKVQDLHSEERCLQEQVCRFSIDKHTLTIEDFMLSETQPQHIKDLLDKWRVLGSTPNNAQQKANGIVLKLSLSDNEAALKILEQNGITL